MTNRGGSPNTDPIGDCCDRPARPRGRHKFLVRWVVGRSILRCLRLGRRGSFLDPLDSSPLRPNALERGRLGPSRRLGGYAVRVAPEYHGLRLGAIAVFHDGSWICGETLARGPGAESERARRRTLALAIPRVARQLGSKCEHQHRWWARASRASSRGGLAVRGTKIFRMAQRGMERSP